MGFITPEAILNGQTGYTNCKSGSCCCVTGYYRSEQRIFCLARLCWRLFIHSLTHAGAAIFEQLLRKIRNILTCQQAKQVRNPLTVISQSPSGVKTNKLVREIYSQTVKTNNKPPKTSNKLPSAGNKPVKTSNKLLSSGNKTLSSGNKPPMESNKPMTTGNKPMKISN